MSWIFASLWMAMWIMVISGCGWPPFPLPLAAPARVSRGMARPSLPSAVQGPPYTAWASKPPPVVEAPPVEGGGGSGKGGKKKVEKGARKKRLVFVADGLAYCRLLGPLRVPPLALRVPPTHAEHTLYGGHPTCSACTLGPEGCTLPRGPRRVPLVMRPRVRARAAKTKRKLPNT